MEWLLSLIMIILHKRTFFIGNHEFIKLGFTSLIFSIVNTINCHIIIDSNIKEISQSIFFSK